MGMMVWVKITKTTLMRSGHNKDYVTYRHLSVDDVLGTGVTDYKHEGYHNTWDDYIYELIEDISEDWESYDVSFEFKEPPVDWLQVKIGRNLTRIDNLKSENAIMESLLSKYKLKEFLDED